jgi:outer membrane protein insertion porin family
MLADRLLAIASICVAVFCIACGCNLPRLANESLPIPPAQIDASQLETVRFQSPQQNNRVRSLNDLSFDAAADLQKNQLNQPAKQADRVAEVVFRGNRLMDSSTLSRQLRTRAGRFFDPDKLQQDINDLWRMPGINRVKGPFLNRTPAGVIVTLEIIETSNISEIKFVGNRGISDTALKKEIGLKDGQPLDVHEIRMAKNKLETMYKNKGYPRTQVEIMEGNETGDNNVVFLIHEDEKQRIWKVDFEGNNIAPDGRLKALIKSKPGIMKLIGGLVKRDEIDQDITRLTTYYRSLGFFNARIGREISESNDGRWLTLRFIINEGPRYRVRNVSFIGNSAYTAQQLESMIELKPGVNDSPEFNVAKMNADVVSLRDLYGGQGFILANVVAEPRFLEEPGQLDLVYKITEGKQYYAGDINIHYEGGGGGVTRREVVLNRLSVRTGDLIDVREIRNSERRLGSANVFATGGPQGGTPPRIVVTPPELSDVARTASRPSPSRSRSRPPSGGSGSRSQGSGSRF